MNYSVPQVSQNKSKSKSKDSLMMTMTRIKRMIFTSVNEKSRGLVHYPVRSRLSKTSFKVKYVPSRNITT